MIVMIVRDDGLGGYRLNDLIISNPLDFAWLRIAVIQADHFHVLADRRVDVAGMLVNDWATCNGESQHGRLLRLKRRSFGNGGSTQGI